MKSVIKRHVNLEKITRGDSTLVHIGDSIEWLRGREKDRFVVGDVLLVRNDFDIVEYHTVGQWTEYIWGGAGVWYKSRYDSMGLLHSEYLNYDKQGMFKDFEVKQILRNDSIIENFIWYHRDGSIKEEQAYYVIHRYNPKHRERRKIKKLGRPKKYPQQADHE
jgi:hypothetical protein